MSVMVTVSFQYKPEAVEAALAGMKEALVDTRAFAGCESVKSYFNAETNTLLLVEIWDRAESQQAYLGWRAETGMMETIADIIAAPPVFTTYDIRDDI
jgi:quinol monooxygenase YgiN